MTAVRLAPEPAAFGIIFDMFTGLRLGKLCGLRWENVDMENKSFLICETRNRLPNHDDSIAASTTVKTTPTTKTDNSRRRVFIMDELFHDFEMYRSIQMSIKEQDYSYSPECYVFCQENGSPYEPRTYQDLFKRCIRQADIPDVPERVVLPLIFRLESAPNGFPLRPIAPSHCPRWERRSCSPPYPQYRSWER